MYHEKLLTLFTAFCLLAVLLPALQSGAAAAPQPKLAVYVDKENHSFIPLRFLNGFAGIQSVLTASGGQIEISRGENSITFTPGKPGLPLTASPLP